MSVAGIINIVTIGLELVNHFLDLRNKDYKKISLPEKTKSKLALLRSEKRAQKKYKGKKNEDNKK